MTRYPVGVGVWRRVVGILLLAALVTACVRPAAPAPTPAATPIPAVPLSARSGDARASGVVFPAQKADLGFSAPGRVQTLTVGVGEQVEAGAMLVALDGLAASAALAQAQAALLRAKAQLAELQVGARPQEIAVSQAALEAAEARLAQLTEGARSEEVAAAQAELASARAAQNQLFAGPRESDRISAEAALSNAEAARTQAQAAYDKIAWRNDAGMLPESRQLQEATNNYEAAKARYDALFANPDADVSAAAQARVQQAQAALERLLGPASAGQLAEVEAQVRSAEAALDLLKADTRAESVAVAEAAVAEAEAALQLAEANLAATHLVAPFAGTVTTLGVNLGEMVLPGEVVLTLADLSHLQVETTDLSERDIARVTVGQPATVFLEALNTDVPGHVARIAQQATTIGGDVVYPVIIELEKQPPDLRWGMSVEVDIQAE